MGVEERKDRCSILGNSLNQMIGWSHCWKSSYRNNIESVVWLCSNGERRTRFNPEQSMFASLGMYYSLLFICIKYTACIKMGECISRKLMAYN